MTTNVLLPERTFNISTPEHKQAWQRLAAQLRDAGWQFEVSEDSILIGSDLAVGARVRIQLSDARQSTVPAPDGFAVLQAMGAAAMDTILCDSVPRGIRVDKVVIGFNWTLVRAGALCGIARSPSRATAGARTVRPPTGFRGLDLADLARYLQSTDPLARSVGLAAVNAYWNQAAADYQELVPVGGFAGLQAPGEGVVIIGGFRGAARRLPKARVVEQEPKAGDIPATEAGPAIARAQVLAITAQTLMNGSLSPLLMRSQEVPRRMLIGPSAPLCPLLLDYGLDEISAAVIIDADAAEAFICETGTMIMLDHIARSAYLQRPVKPLP